MAMSTPVKGERASPNEDGQLLLKEGQYGKGTDGIWYARPPDNHMGSLAGHAVVEHEDGTITASPSILITDWRCGQWHGYLRRGVWTQV
jgi:hypothetical protein